MFVRTYGSGRELQRLAGSYAVNTFVRRNSTIVMKQQEALEASNKDLSEKVGNAIESLPYMPIAGEKRAVLTGLF